ncbi:hypothetical protein JCM11491_006728 [Sporobolomyces phaffii]
MTSCPRRVVIVGLGNYTHPLTKHSVGQLLLQNLARRAASVPRATGSAHLSLSKPFPRATTSSWTTQITVHHSDNSDSLELLFIQPKALMNVCGKTILDAARAFLPPVSTPTTTVGQLKPILKLVVLSDDLDLAPGRSRAQRAGGPRGHNGVRSLVAALGGTRDFHRFWVGIGRPPGHEHHERGHGVARWVLGPLSREEVAAVEWDDDAKRGGPVLEAAWREVLRIGFEEG